MTESETEERFQAPFVMGESMIPPTGVQTEVTEKVGNVALRFYCNDRTVNTWVCMSPEEATELAERLTEQVEQLEKD